MDSSILSYIENELDELWKKHGALPRQRDAWYWGFLIGIEIENKIRGLPSVTNYISTHEVLNPRLLRKNINRFFVKKGFFIQDRIHFEKGISNGRLYVEKRHKNKSTN